MPENKVFSIPPGASFVESLARGLLDKTGDDPTVLSRMTILLPTRRACRTLADAFLAQSKGRALLLPNMTPIGDLGSNEDETAEATELTGADMADIPPAIPELRRRLMLTRLILQKAVVEKDIHHSPAQAVELAAELARLLDQVQTERLSFADLAGLVPDDYARHWQVTLDFLKIVTEIWPAVLAEIGCLDPAERRNRIIAARIDAWRDDPPTEPIIAAGSTGTIPATADLIAAVAQLPAGMVVLPGLDTELTDDSLAHLGPTHPQFGMANLLERFALKPSQVPVWPGALVSPRAASRASLLRHAMHPAASPAEDLEESEVDDALAGISAVNCPSPREEATVIALMLREQLNSPDKTAALVTPDRALARRVAMEMRRWGVAIDDSSGWNLGDTPPGVFLRLTAMMAAEDAAPVALLAVLKHPLAAGGMAPADFRARARELERAVLRGPRPGGGLAGLVRLVRSARQGEKHNEALGDWLENLAGMAKDFTDQMGSRPLPISQLLAGHVAFAEALAASDRQPGAQRLWAGQAGEEAAALINDLASASSVMGPIPGEAWPAFLDAMMADKVVRPLYGQHPRVNIWGPLEARLQQADLIVLGGLNEGSWPREPVADPWMSRPMREKFGLFPLERRVGLAAHDFAQAFTADQIALTRSNRVDGTPTVPSRWLLRLENSLERVNKGGALTANQNTWLAWQDALDASGDEVQIRAPAPRPPVDIRPRQLSVTQIETLMRDPYGIYARHILKLRALEPIDADPGAAERGNFIHQALDDFLRAFPDHIPEDALEQMLAIGEAAFGEALGRPGVRAFWWPRFERIAEWFINQERDFRAGLTQIHSEVSGRITFDAPAGPFTLTAKADRVDELTGGGLAIADYKTGAVPAAKDIRGGVSSQLSLEAVIAQAGGFDGVPAQPAAMLTYWKLSGGDPPGELSPAGPDAMALAEEALAGLESLIAEFDDPETPYLSQPDPDRAPRFSDYRHLARIQEWIAQSGEDR
jgi:ATP-dependent helicase/nuclease subunit B